VVIGVPGGAVVWVTGGVGNCGPPSTVVTIGGPHTPNVGKSNNHQKQKKIFYKSKTNHKSIKKKQIKSKN
jgi:hypothetical protein